MEDVEEEMSDDEIDGPEFDIVSDADLSESNEEEHARDWDFDWATILLSPVATGSLLHLRASIWNAFQIKTYLCSEIKTRV